MLSTIATFTATTEFEEYCAKRYREDYDFNKTQRIMTKTGIDNFIEKHPEYTRAQVEAEIQVNDMFACLFILDPVQQSCYQKYAAEYIRQLPGAECICLPASGPNALYVYKGKLCHKADIPAVDVKLVKSIDFKVTYGNYTIYASHKHTRKDGGNQSNQWYDLIHFSEHASESTDDNIIYIALADGPYYSHTTAEGPTKMEHLNQRANEHYQAMTTTEFCRWLSTLTV